MASNVRVHRALLIGLIVLAAFSLRMEAFSTFPCPSGSDPGLRVKNAYLLSKEWVNITYPAFDASLALLWITTGETTRGLILSTELFVSAIMALSAASMYVTATRVVKDERASIIVAFLAAFSAPTYELVAFGSYPQGLSLFLIPLIFAVALNSRIRSDISHTLGLGLLSASLLMMHFWSFIICSLAISLFSALDPILRWLGESRETPDRTNKILFFAPILALILSSPWWIPIRPFLQKTLLYTPVGTTSIRGVGWRFERFFSPYWLYYVFLPAGLLALYSYRRTHSRKEMLLLGSWFLTPFILMQGYRFGIGADYRRLWYYPMEPAMILAGLGLSFTAYLMLYPLQRVSRLDLRVKSTPRDRPKRGWGTALLSKGCLRPILASSLILVLAAAVFSPGWWAVREAHSSTRYYSHIRESELGMMFWIGGYVSEGMEILSSGSVGWWIRGLARRHVISVIPRAFINVPWQISRAERVGILVSEASYALKNDWIQARDSGPYWPGFNPDLSVKSGSDYRSVMHLNDTGILLTLSNGKRMSLASLGKRESSWISRGDDTATLQTKYYAEESTLTKTTSLKSSSPFAKIEIGEEGRLGIEDLVIYCYPNEDLRHSLILTEGFERSIEDRTESYIAPPSRWFAVFESEYDLCFILRLNRPTRAIFEVDRGRLLSLRLDLRLEEGGASMEIGGFQVEKVSELRGEIREYLQEEEEYSGREVSSEVSTLDYIEALKEYGIKIIVIGTAEKHGSDPHFNLVFSTGSKFIFENPQ